MSECFTGWKTGLMAWARESMELYPAGSLSPVVFSRAQYWDQFSGLDEGIESTLNPQSASRWSQVCWRAGRLRTMVWGSTTLSVGFCTRFTITPSSPTDLGKVSGKLPSGKESGNAYWQQLNMIQLSPGGQEVQCLYLQQCGLHDCIGLFQPNLFYDSAASRKKCCTRRGLDGILGKI